MDNKTKEAIIRVQQRAYGPQLERMEYMYQMAQNYSSKGQNNSKQPKGSQEKRDESEDNNNAQTYNITKNAAAT